MHVPEVQQFVTQGLFGSRFVEDVMPRTALQFRVLTPCRANPNSWRTVSMPICSTESLPFVLALEKVL